MSLPTTPSGRRQNSPTYLPLLIADRRQAIFGHIRRLLEDTPAHIAVNHTISVLRGVQPVPGWKRPLRCLQKTSLQQVEADHGMDADVSRSHAQDRDCVDIATFDPRWSDAAVSDWVFIYIQFPYIINTKLSKFYPIFTNHIRKYSHLRHLASKFWNNSSAIFLLYRDWLSFSLSLQTNTTTQPQMLSDGMEELTIMNKICIVPLSLKMQRCCKGTSMCLSTV